MNHTKISESFLITEEDYIRMQLEKRSYQVPPENKILLRILGMLAVFCGAAVMIYVRGEFWQQFCWILLIVIGLYNLSYYDVLDPVMIRNASVRFYRFNQKSISSRTIEMTDETISLVSEDHRLKLPKKYLYRIIETASTVFFLIDRDEFIFLPKRVLSEEKLKWIRSYLPAEKYKSIQIPKEV